MCIFSPLISMVSAHASFPGAPTHLSQVCVQLHEEDVREYNGRDHDRPRDCRLSRYVASLCVPIVESDCPVGRDHQRHRKIMNPAFSAAHLRTFLPLFQRIGTKVSRRPIYDVLPCRYSPSQMVEQWKTDLSGAERMSMVVNKWLSRATMDIIGEGASVHCSPRAARSG